MFIKEKLIVSIMSIFLAGAAHAGTVSATFGQLTDFNDGPGGVSTTLTGLDPSISGDLQIDFTFIGDLSVSAENFTLTLDGANFGTGCNNNTGDDSFGIVFNGADNCSQSSNTFITGSLTVANATAAGLLADGSLSLGFLTTRSVNDFVDITNGGGVFSGATFTNARNFSFAVGGTVSYETAPSVVPLPAGAPLLLTGLGAFAFLRRRARKS